jgi:hypothetical protein
MSSASRFSAALRDDAKKTARGNTGGDSLLLPGV